MSEATNQNEEQKVNQENIGGGFGIGADLESSNNFSFPKGGIYGAVLKKASFHEIEIGKEKTKTNVLDFEFSDLDNKRKFTHREFIPERNDKYDKSLEGFNKRIKHIVEAFIEFPKAGIGHTAKSFEEYMEQIVQFFNEAKENSPIYMEGDKYIPVYIKLTYYKNYLKFPLYPNFIEKMRAGKETLLSIDKKYDQIDQMDVPTGMGPGSPNLPGISASSDDVLF